MLQFKKYSEIENSFNNEFMERVAAEVSAIQEFVVQEKVHGSNTSFLCDGRDVRFAKRTAILEDHEQFFDFPELLERHRDRVLALTREVAQKYDNVKEVAVFGEMFGGHYPHKMVPGNHLLKVIQKGVCYTPYHEFYAFDIFVFTEDTGFYLPLDEANDLFERHNFFYAKTLMRGTLAECLRHPNMFQSHIAEWLGFPPIEDNVCEGIVIRPTIPLNLKSHERVLIKSKNERFAEKKAIKKRIKQFHEPVPYSQELLDLLPEAEAYVTEQRLANVVSHIGEVKLPQDFGKLIGMYAQDILKDFLKEHSGPYASLEKSEQKAFNKELNIMASNLVKTVYKEQA